MANYDAKVPLKEIKMENKYKKRCYIVTNMMQTSLKKGLIYIPPHKKL